MLSMASKNWWVFALRGLFAILFGILALIWPGATLLTLVLLFGAFAFFNGIFSIVAGIASFRSSDRWWAQLLEGVVSVLIGLATFFWPGMTTLVLLFFIASWAILTGVLQIAAAIRLRREITNEWSMGLGGALTVLFGILLFLFPGAGALSVIWVIGLYAILFGVVMMVLAFRLRSLRQAVDLPADPRL